MQAARHRGHLGRAERAGTAAPGAYRTLKFPTRHAPTMLQTAGRLPGHQEEEEGEGSGSLTRAASAAAAGSPVRAASTRSAFIGIRRAAVACVRGLSCDPGPALVNLCFINRGPPPPAAERMRGYARARGWSDVGTGSTSRQGTKRREEVEGRGSLTRTALAAAGGCVDSLISGRQARSVRSTPSGSPMRAALIRSASTSVRPPAVGCVCSLSCASLPPPSSTNRSSRMPPSTCRLRMRDDRARPRVVR
ncbi:hypothetical protein EVAR_80080_1 [Eumeta japonica]|uniref:Uncharacterized protein n=1 Tax=Eumeta variegata TaxID=151549 RepID=A0A4C1UDN1_EUMVA|nr:hypothetical protein EVAR_80080_1 [Eumeta japonica]